MNDVERRMAGASAGQASHRETCGKKILREKQGATPRNLVARLKIADEDEFHENDGVAGFLFLRLSNSGITGLLSAFILSV